MDNSVHEAMYGSFMCIYMADLPALYLEYTNGSPERMLCILYLQRIIYNLKSQ